MLSRLNEKLILYGRTGIPPGSQENLQLLKEKGFRDSRPNSQEGSASLGVGLNDQGQGQGQGQCQLGQGQKGPTFSLLQGEALRCLSPAEEVRNDEVKAALSHLISTFTLFHSGRSSAPERETRSSRFETPIQLGSRLQLLRSSGERKWENPVQENSLFGGTLCPCRLSPLSPRSRSRSI